jgi:hypothetical protein
VISLRYMISTTKNENQGGSDDDEPARSVIQPSARGSDDGSWACRLTLKVVSLEERTCLTLYILLIG